MIRKILIVLTCFLIIFTTIPISKVDAAAPILRVVAGSSGERAVIAVLERSGVKLATKSAQEKAVERWNLELYKRYEQAYLKEQAENKLAYESMLQRLNSAPVPIPEKPGFGKIILSGAMFLTGADIAYNATNAIINAKSNQEALDFMAEATRQLKTGETLSALPGVAVYLAFNPDTNNNAIYFDDGLACQFNACFITSVGHQGDFLPPMTINKTSNTYTINDELYQEYRYRFYRIHNGSQRETTTLARAKVTDPYVYNVEPAIEEVPQIEAFPEPLRRYYEDLLIAEQPQDVPLPEGLPETVEIVVPLDEPYPISEPTPLNEPINLTEPEPGTGPGTEPGTGPGTGTEIPPGLEPPVEPTPTNPFGLPGTFISCFLGLFKAIILYLIRLFNFVLTIPLTPMKSFDNGAFDWFRTSKFLGIYVYDVVSLMASIALGLGVFNKIKTIFGRG